MSTYELHFARRNPARESIAVDVAALPLGWDWYPDEVHPQHGIVRWSGPTSQSLVDLPRIVRPASISLRIVHALGAEFLDRFALFCNDVEVRRGLTRLRLAVPRTVAPAEVDPANHDRRRLGVCLQSIHVG